MDRAKRLMEHQRALRDCRACPRMQGPVVVGKPVISPVMSVGQAPGTREGPAGRPFAWTAGKTLFKWFEPLGMDEEAFRGRVYMAAVCRCFPGKNPGGGDRVPDRGEIENCRRWLDREIELIQPQLIIPIGKLAIEQFMPPSKLSETVGRVHRIEVNGHLRDVAPLPHPSGLNTWFRTEPGKGLLRDALGLIGRHPAWLSIRP